MTSWSHSAESGQNQDIQSRGFPEECHKQTLLFSNVSIVVLTKREFAFTDYTLFGSSQ